MGTFPSNLTYLKTCILLQNLKQKEGNTSTGPLSTVNCQSQTSPLRFLLSHKGKSKHLCICVSENPLSCFYPDSRRLILPILFLCFSFCVFYFLYVWCYLLPPFHCSYNAFNTFASGADHQCQSGWFAGGPRRARKRAGAAF